MAENNTTGYELGWDDSIEKDGPDYITLPVGDYDFTISKFERGRYSPKPGGKLPPCNMAILFIVLDGGAAGSCTVKHNLYLHTSTEGLLCEFFTAIGQRRHGERVSMNWNAVVGASGRCKVGVRTYQNKDGEDVTLNEVKKFYEPDPGKPARIVPAPISEFKPGVF